MLNPLFELLVWPHEVEQWFHSVQSFSDYTIMTHILPTKKFFYQSGISFTVLLYHRTIDWILLVVKIGTRNQQVLLNNHI